MIASAVALFIPKDLSFTGFLGENDPEVIQFNREFEAFGTYSMLLMLLEGPDDEIQQVTTALTERLSEESPAVTVLPPSDVTWFKDHAAWLWPDPIFNAVMTDLESGTVKSFTLKSLETADIYIENLIAPTKNAALLSVEIEGSPLDMSVGGAHFMSIEAAAKRIVKEMDVGVTVEFTGLSAVGGQDQGAVVSKIIYLTPFTIIGVLFLVYLIEPRMSRVVVAGLALGGSVVMGLALVGMIQGRITLGSAFFGLLLLGLGIDFGIHLLVALRDGRAHGMSPDEALHKAFNATVEPIVLGAFSSALAFGVIMLIPHSLTRDMGLTAFFGVLLAMVTMLSLLPAGWLMLERRHANLDSPAHLNIPGLPNLVRFSINHPKLVLSVGLTLALVGAAGLPRYETETDLEKIFSRDVPALAVADRIGEIFGTATTTYTARVENLEQAREWSEALVKLPAVASVSSPTDIITENPDVRMAAMSERLDAVSIDSLSDDMKLLTSRVARALEVGPITIETIPPWLGAGILSKDGSMALNIKPHKNSLDALVLDGEINQIRSVAPTATGVPVIVRMATLGLSKYVPYMVPMVFVVVTLVLIVAFRDVQGVLLALLPVVTATSITFGFYFWLGLQFSTLTVVVVPVILGLGVDDGIHIVERLRRYKSPTREQLQEAVVGVGRPIFLTTTTTCVSFLALLFTDHSGLESIANFMLVGVPLCFLTSVTMVPAAAMLFIVKED
ncbi:MAG: MMPL family transporter [Candidatus Hydrogenedentota bacterium]